MGGMEGIRVNPLNPLWIQHCNNCRNTGLEWTASETHRREEIYVNGHNFPLEVLLLLNRKRVYLTWRLPNLCLLLLYLRRQIQINVRKRAKIRNRYNQAPHLTQDTNWKVTSQYDITNESQEVIPFPAGDQKAAANRRA